MDVLAKVETIKPGDRVFTPRGRHDGYVVEQVAGYDDGTFVVTYRTGVSSRMRFGSVLAVTDDVLASLVPMAAGTRVRCRRASS